MKILNQTEKNSDKKKPIKGISTIFRFKKALKDSNTASIPVINYQNGYY